MPTRIVRRLDANHDKTWGAGKRNYASGSEAAGQNVLCRLLVIHGEWFLNIEDGLPWWQDPSTDVRPIMGVPRDLGYSEALIKRRILGSDGIATIGTFDSDFNPETRKWDVRAVDGETVDGEPWEIKEVQV